MKKILLIIGACVAATTAWATWDEQAVLARRLSADAFLLDKQAYLAQSAYTNGVFFDYNNDGLLDLLIVGRGGDWTIKADVNMGALYRNLGAEADYRLQRVSDTGLLPFTDEGYYNPVSAGDVDHDGYTDLLIMTYHDGRHIDLYLNDNGTGRFIRQESVQFEAATNGSCMLGDLDGDGWLDVEFSGYSDRSATALKLYRNQHDGTFSDISQANVTGAFQGGSALADINGDGHLDIIATGNGNNWVCLAPIYLSQGDGTFTTVTESRSGVKGVSRATPLVVDLNADGRMDMIVNGEPANVKGSGSGLNPRTAIGYYAPGHYCFVQVDGRRTPSALEKGKKNAGLTLKNLSKLMESLGCKAAYNLDGGQSSLMYFHGKIHSTPYKNGRRLSDIVLIRELK